MMMRKEEKKEGKKREPVKISRHNRVQTAVRTGFPPPLLLQWPHSTSHTANANGTKNPPGACQDASGKWEREGGWGWGVCVCGGGGGGLTVRTQQCSLT